MGMNWTDAGGYLYSPELNERFQKQLQPKLRFRQFVDLKPSFGMHKGQTVNWLKVANASNYGGSVAETSTIPTTTVPLSWGTLTVGEYGLSVPFTFKLQALSEFEIDAIIRQALLDDSAKVIDGVVEREFNATPMRYVGTSTSGYALTTNGTATATNTSPLNRFHVKNILDNLRNNNVGGFEEAEDDIVCIGSPTALRGIKDDLETIKSYTDLGIRQVFAGEIGRYDRCRFVEATFATRYIFDATARTATAISWTTGNSAPAYFFGKGTVMEGLVLPEQIRVKDGSQDYGRDKGIAWYGLMGWKIQWDDATNYRIIKWDSAA